MFLCIELSILFFTKGDYQLQVRLENQIYEILFMFFTLCISYSFLHSIFLTLFITFFLSFLFVFANIFKIKYLGQPVFLSDLSLIRQGYIALLEISKSNIYFFVISFLPVFLGIFFLTFIFKQLELKLNLIKRMVIILISFLFFSFYTLLFLSKSIKEYYHDIAENYYNNGFLLSFLHESIYLNKLKVRGYNKNKILEILTKLNSVEFKTDTFSIDNMDIIIIQLEAFFDPKTLGIKFNKNPIPYFDYLRTKYLSSELITPAFGGGTTKTEFQVLTGIDYNLLKTNWNPYAYIKNNRNWNFSLPHLFKLKGFNTIFIHPYFDWFYNRKEVLPKLGFERLYWDRDFKNAKFLRYYISDESFVDKIIELLEKNKQEKNFIYAVSIAGHGPYVGNYTNSDIFVTENSGGEVEKELNEYINLIYETDKAIKRLITYLEKSNKKTLVTIFSDHLPAFLKTFEKINFINKVPIIFWSNFACDYKIENEIEAHMVGSIILDLCNIEPNEFFKFKKLYQKKNLI